MTGKRQPTTDRRRLDTIPPLDEGVLGLRLMRMVEWWMCAMEENRRNGSDPNCSEHFGPSRMPTGATIPPSPVPHSALPQATTRAEAPLNGVRT